MKTQEVTFNLKLELAVANMDSKLNIYDIAKSYKEYKVDPLKVKAWKIDFHPSGKELLSGSTGLWLSNAEDGTLIKEFSTDSRFITSLKYSPTGKLIATGNVDGGLILYKTEDYNSIAALEDHALTIRDINFTRDETAVLSASDDMHINVTDL